VGLEKRLLQEKTHPKADLFWNSENLRTTRLDSHSLFTPQTDIFFAIAKEEIIILSGLYFLIFLDRTFINIG
jgi:hypothetical protein